MVYARWSIWEDERAGSRITVVRTVLPNPALAAAIQAASVGNVGRYTEFLEVASGGVPGSGPYGTRDHCELVFQDNCGGSLRLFVPAPRADLFQPDGETANLLSPFVLAIKSAALGSLTTTAGGTALLLVGGTRGRRG